MAHLIGQLYSEAYDLLARKDRPKTRYMVASIPRSGSTYFCLQMWRQGVFGAPMEYINFPRLRRLIDRLGSGDVVRHWRRVQRVRTTPNGVFGYKSFVPDLLLTPNAAWLIASVEVARFACCFASRIFGGSARVQVKRECAHRESKY